MQKLKSFHKFIYANLTKQEESLRYSVGIDSLNKRLERLDTFVNNMVQDIRSKLNASIYYRFSSQAVSTQIQNFSKGVLQYINELSIDFQLLKLSSLQKQLMHIISGYELQIKFLQQSFNYHMQIKQKKPHFFSRHLCSRCEQSFDDAQLETINMKHTKTILYKCQKDVINNYQRQWYSSLQKHRFEEAEYKLKQMVEENYIHQILEESKTRCLKLNFQDTCVVLQDLLESYFKNNSSIPHGKQIDSKLIYTSGQSMVTRILETIANDISGILNNQFKEYINRYSKVLLISKMKHYRERLINCQIQTDQVDMVQQMIKLQQKLIQHIQFEELLQQKCLKQENTINTLQNELAILKEEAKEIEKKNSVYNERNIYLDKQCKDLKSKRAHYKIQISSLISELETIQKKKDRKHVVDVGILTAMHNSSVGLNCTILKEQSILTSGKKQKGYILNKKIPIKERQKKQQQKKQEKNQANKQKQEPEQEQEQVMRKQRKIYEVKSKSKSDLNDKTEREEEERKAEIHQKVQQEELMQEGNQKDHDNQINNEFELEQQDQIEIEIEKHDIKTEQELQIRQISPQKQQQQADQDYKQKYIISNDQLAPTIKKYTHQEQFSFMITGYLTLKKHKKNHTNDKPSQQQIMLQSKIAASNLLEDSQTQKSDIDDMQLNDIVDFEQMLNQKKVRQPLRKKNKPKQKNEEPIRQVVFDSQIIRSSVNKSKSKPKNVVSSLANLESSQLLNKPTESASMSKVHTKKSIWQQQKKAKTVQRKDDYEQHNEKQDQQILSARQVIHVNAISKRIEQKQQVFEGEKTPNNQQIHQLCESNASPSQKGKQISLYKPQMSKIQKNKEMMRKSKRLIKPHDSLIINQPILEQAADTTYAKIKEKRINSLVPPKKNTLQSINPRKKRVNSSQPFIGMNKLTNPTTNPLNIVNKVIPVTEEKKHEIVHLKKQLQIKEHKLKGGKNVEGKKKQQQLGKKKLQKRIISGSNSLFHISNLGIFGGLSQAYSYQQKQIEYHLSNKQQQLAQVLAQQFDIFLQKLSHNNRRQYEQISCFIQWPYDSCMGQGVLRKQRGGGSSLPFFRCIVNQHSDCNLEICDHIQQFLQKVSFYSTEGFTFFP